MTDNVDNINIVKLKSISNDIELNMIKEILSNNDIPYIVKDYGSGGYMRIISGISLQETDVMIAKSDLEKAKNLLEAIGIS